MKLPVNKANLTGLGARNCATIQQAKNIKLHLSTRKITSHRKTFNLHITSP